MSLSHIKILSLAAIALSFSVTPSLQAQSDSNHYQIVLKEAAKKDKKIIRGVMISCAETQCRGKATGSSSANMCAQIARTFGAVKSFSAGENIFNEDEIKKCNEKA